MADLKTSLHPDAIARMEMLKSAVSSAVDSDYRDKLKAGNLVTVGMADEANRLSTSNHASSVR